MSDGRERLQRVLLETSKPVILDGEMYGGFHPKDHRGKAKLGDAARAEGLRITWKRYELNEEKFTDGTV